MSEANVKALRRFIAEARRVGCMRPHDGRQLDEDMEGLILGADDAAKRLSAIVREREEAVRSRQTAERVCIILRNERDEARAEAERLRADLKQGTKNALDELDRLHDARRALASRVRAELKKTAEAYLHVEPRPGETPDDLDHIAAYSNGTVRRILAAFDALDLTPLLEPKEGA